MNIHHIRRLDIINTEQKLVGVPTDKDKFKMILSNKRLLLYYFNNESFESSYSLLGKFRDRIFETIYQPK